MSVLAVEGLRVRLPTPAGDVTVVDGVDYDVQPSEVFGIAGESGSGKTVSMLALFGLLPMAISTGVGSETQRPFALVIVGGMVTTLIITLFVLPAVYYVLASEKYETPEQLDEAA